MRELLKTKEEKEYRAMLAKKFQQEDIDDAKDDEFYRDFSKMPHSSAMYKVANSTKLDVVGKQLFGK